MKADYKALADLLQDAMKGRRIVAVHMWDDEPDIFAAGFVTRVGPSEAEFEWVKPGGGLDEDDDTGEAKFSKIVRLVLDSVYLRELEFLHANWGPPIRSRATRSELM